MNQKDCKTLISQMTLEEKASLCSGADNWHTKSIDRLHIPSVMLSDGPHGLRKKKEGSAQQAAGTIKAVCFPPSCATAASFDRELIRTIGENIGDSCQHEEIAVVLGPAVNIKRSPLCGRNFEYYSEDPYLAGEMAASFAKGVQSRDVGVSVKHFAVNNQEHRRMSTSAEVDERTMREIYLPAFETVVKQAKPWTVMCSYNRINGIYASENKAYLSDILRGEWGFGGYVMSDWGAVNDRVKGIEAGLDLEMPSSNGTNDQRIVDAVRNGMLDERLVNQAAERILNVNDRYLENAKPETLWDMEAQHALVRKAAAECMVLLKNNDDILPLKKEASIAIIGQFAKTPRLQGGGSSHIHCSKVTSLMDALEGMPNITYAQGYDVLTEEPDNRLIQEAVQTAGSAEYAVIIAGLPDSFESEGYDRTHMRMPICQNALISEVAKANPNTIVILYNGSPVEMPWIMDAKAVVEGYLGGQAVGGATKDVLFGTVNPCGRLPETFPLRLEDTPCYINYGGEKDISVYSEGIFVGYRYYDKKKMDVLFPFGYGLSYTTFQYSNLTLNTSRMKDTDTLVVKVDVTNTGKRFGKEVVQLYVGDKESTVLRPVRELKDFAKVALVPGETKTVTFMLDKRAFAYWNIQLHDWYVETGMFTVEVGISSRHIALNADVWVESTVTVPERITVNTTLGDIMKNPRAMAVLEPIIKQFTKSFGNRASDEEANSRSAAMEQAMIQYMPLRGIISFGQNLCSYEQLLAVVQNINTAADENV